MTYAIICKIGLRRISDVKIRDVFKRNKSILSVNFYERLCSFENTRILSRES